MIFWWMKNSLQAILVFCMLLLVFAIALRDIGTQVIIKARMIMYGDICCSCFYFWLKDMLLMISILAEGYVVDDINPG